MCCRNMLRGLLCPSLKLCTFAVLNRKTWIQISTKKWSPLSCAIDQQSNFFHFLFCRGHQSGSLCSAYWFGIGFMGVYQKPLLKQPSHLSGFGTMSGSAGFSVLPVDTSACDSPLYPSCHDHPHCTTTTFTMPKPLFKLPCNQAEQTNQTLNLLIVR